MKKILSILGTISLITSWSNNLIGCDKNTNDNDKNIKSNEQEPTIEPEKSKSEQPPENSNWKLIDYPTSKNKLHDLFKNPDTKWYAVNLFTAQEGHIIRKFKFTNETKLVKKIDYGELPWKYNLKYYEGLPTELVGYYRYIYLWNGLDEPKLPEINNSGIITDWNEKTDLIVCFFILDTSCITYKNNKNLKFK